MDVAQMVIIGIMIILIIISYFKIAYSLDREKFKTGLLFLALLTFVSCIAVTILIMVLETKNELEEKVKNKCPEYEEIHNVYKLKTK